MRNGTSKDVERPTASVEGPPHDRREVLSHPAFGQFKVFHQTGTSALYGADFEPPGCVRLEVTTSSLERRLAGDLHRDGETVVSVAMTFDQWARAMSTPNMGEGVPCTILKRPGGRAQDMPGFPPRDGGEPAHTADGERTTAEAVEGLRELEELIAGVPGLTAANRRKLQEACATSRRKLDDTIPFIMESFREHMATRAAKARLEIMAFAKLVGITGRKAGPRAAVEDGGRDRGSDAGV